jgi:hypothetical protein
MAGRQAAIAAFFFPFCPHAMAEQEGMMALHVRSERIIYAAAQAAQKK